MIEILYPGENHNKLGRAVSIRNHMGRVSYLCTKGPKPCKEAASEERKCSWLVRKWVTCLGAHFGPSVVVVRTHTSLLLSDRHGGSSTGKVKLKGSQYQELPSHANISFPTNTQSQHSHDLDTYLHQPFDALRTKNDYEREEEQSSQCIARIL